MSAVVAVLVGLGAGVVVLSSLLAHVPRDALDRLHYLTPVTSLGAPLIGVGLVVANGWGLTSLTVALTTVLLVLTGPIMVSATGRMTVQRRAETRR
jgi:multisubunit Na+/H+ antiporter MnhG subunit